MGNGLGFSCPSTGKYEKRPFIVKYRFFLTLIKGIQVFHAGKLYHTKVWINV
jgi:hypothetical protein